MCLTVILAILQLFMADIVQEGQQQQNNGEQAIVDIKEQMRHSLAGWNNNGSEPAANGEQKKPQESANGQQDKSEIIPEFSFEPFKQLGYTKTEDAIKEINELRELRKNPPKPEAAEIAFENPISEQLFKALQAGKTKEVASILYQQDRLESLSALEVNADNSAEIIKFGMQFKHPTLSQKEIDYKYNKQFSLPKSPVKGAEELDEDFEVKKAEWQAQVDDIQMSRIIEAKLLQPELAAAKSKLVLPEISQEVDKDYEQWKQSLNNQTKSNEEIVGSYKAYTADSLEMKVDFKDEANKVDFKFQYKPTQEQFTQALDIVANFQKFFDHFKKPDGTPDREGFLQALVFAVNRKEILSEALKQAKNGTIKSNLPDNTQGALVRHMTGNDKQENEVDKMMKQSLAGWVATK